MADLLKYYYPQTDPVIWSPVVADNRSQYSAADCQHVVAGRVRQVVVVDARYFSMGKQSVLIKVIVPAMVVYVRGRPRQVLLYS